MALLGSQTVVSIFGLQNAGLAHNTRLGARSDVHWVLQLSNCQRPL